VAVSSEHSIEISRRYGEFRLDAQKLVLLAGSSKMQENVSSLTRYEGTEQESKLYTSTHFEARSSIRLGPVAYRGGEGCEGLNPPPPEIPKALQNRAKLNPIVKTVKNC